jgi:hypothetical protein
VHTGRVKLVLAEWPGLNPPVSRLEIDDVILRVPSAGDTLVSSVMRFFQRMRAPSKGSGIPKVIMSKAAVALVGGQVREMLCENAQLWAVKRENCYVFSLEGPESWAWGFLQARGRIDLKTLDIDLSLRVEHEVTKRETDLVFGGIDGSKILGEGRLKADLALVGCLKEPEKVKPKGSVKLTDWTVAVGERVVATKVDVDAKLDGSEVTLENFRASDANGIERVSSRSIRLGLQDWPGLQPVLTEVEAEGLKVQASLAGDGYPVAAGFFEGESDRSKRANFDIQKVVVRDATIGVTDREGSKVEFDRLFFRAVKENEHYKVSAARNVPEDLSSVSMEAVIKPKTWDSELSLRIEHPVKRAQMRVLFRALEVPELSAEGKLAAEMALTGCLKEPANLRANGSITLREWTVETEDKVVLSNLRLDAKLDGSEVVLENVSACDANGIDRLSARRLRLGLRDWPGMQPVVTEVEADGLNVQASLTGDGSASPLDFMEREPGDSKTERFDIQKMVVRDATISLTGGEDRKMVFDNLSLEVLKKQERYDILLMQNAAERVSMIFAEGSIDRLTSGMRFSLQMRRRMSKGGMGAVFAALDMPNLSGQGKVEADLMFTGSLDDLHGLWAEGTVRLSDWSLTKSDALMVTDLVTEAKVKGRRLDFENITATLCKGGVNGAFYLVAEHDEPAAFGGQLSAQKMSFADLSSALGRPTKEGTKGSVSLFYGFTGKGSGVKGLQGRGHIFLDDADMSVVPIVPDIFRAMGLASLDPLSMSDAECVFVMDGAVATLKSGHIANSYAAIDAEPGGTLNLETGQIDMHVVAVPLKHVQAVVKKVPLVNILANLKDKLTRLSVRGDWSQPPAKLISKEPIKDIRDGTVGFVQDVATTGGQFTQQMLTSFRALLGAAQEAQRPKVEK